MEFRLNRFISVGLGTALYIAEFSQVEPNDEVSSRNQNIGYIADIGLLLPSKGRSYFEVKWQFRGVGGTNIGPYDVTILSGSVNFTGAKASFNHSYLGVGFGFRF